MGRQPCCDKVGLKKGPWTGEEDHKLINFILNNGHCCWRAVPKLAGLLRCGKSCRLRWTNYLRPDLKRGVLSESEEKLIIDLHSRLGNRWSRIASQLPGRTDNEIKNYWNTHIKKKLQRMGIDPVTHQSTANQQQEPPNTDSNAPKKTNNSCHKIQASTPSTKSEITEADNGILSYGFDPCGELSSVAQAQYFENFATTSPSLASLDFVNGNRNAMPFHLQEGTPFFRITEEGLLGSQSVEINNVFQQIKDPYALNSLSNVIGEAGASNNSSAETQWAADTGSILPMPEMDMQLSVWNPEDTFPGWYGDILMQHQCHGTPLSSNCCDSTLFY